MPGGALDHDIVDVIFKFGGGGAQKCFVHVETSARGTDMESEDARGDEAVSVSVSELGGCEEGELTPHSAVMVPASLQALLGAIQTYEIVILNTTNKFYAVLLWDICFGEILSLSLC